MFEVKIVVLVMCSMLLIMITACSQGRDISIQEQDGRITISTAQHKLTAQKNETDSGTFLVVSASRQKLPDFLQYLDCRVVLIPLAKAEELKARHGNFLLSENSGHTSARKSSQTEYILASNAPVRKKINKIIELRNARSFPVVRMTRTKIIATGLSYNGKPFMPKGGIVMNYIIGEIEIVQKDYPL